MDPVLLQKQVHDNAEDLRNYMQDLRSWEADMKRKESELQAAASSDQTLPPVRSKIKRISQDQKSKCATENHRPARISGYDYVSWDKFDVDKACEDLDGGRHQESEEGGDDIVIDDKEKRLREEAIYEKEMGNNFVKKQKWNEAIRCYSRAIKCFPYDAIFYANRALCYLKTDDLRSAEVDCTIALQLDSTYVKAYQRRAMARSGLGQLQEARSDLLKVMELEPKNMASKAELMKLEKKINIKSQPKQSVEQPGLAACQNTVTQQTENTSSHTLKSKKSKEESDTRNKSVRSHKEIIKAEDKIVTHISGKQTVATKETEKKVKCSTNQEIMERQREESRLQENIMSKEQIWPMHGEVKLVQTLYKPPHLRLKKPLKRIEIREVDNNSSEEHGTGTKTFCSGGTALKIKSPDISVGSDTGMSSSDKEQKAKASCKSDVAAGSEVKPASEKMNFASQNTVLEDVPPIPNTSVQFLMAWKRVRANPQLSYRYLKQIPGADLPKIFQDSLESSTLSDIICTIKNGFLQLKEPVLPYVMGLSDVRRFNALAMFLSESDKEGIKKILEYCKEQGECSEKESKDLMKKYEIS